MFSVCSILRFEVNEYGFDVWEGFFVNLFLFDVVCDDSNIVIGNIVREIVLMCFYIFVINVVSRRVIIYW